MIVEIILFCTVLILSVIYFDYIKKTKYYDLWKNYGGPKGLPFVGVYFNMMNFPRHFYDWPRLIKNKLSKSVFVWYGPFPTFLTYNPKFIEKLLLSSDCIDKSDMYSLIHRELGPGILTASGLQWRQQRKLLSPSFNHRVLMEFFPTFNTEANMLVNEIGTRVGKDEEEILEHIQKYTVRTAFGTLLDFKFDSTKQNEELTFHLDRFLSIYLYRQARITKSNDFLFQFSTLCGPYYESKKIVYDFIDKLISDKIHNFKLSQFDDFEDIQKSNRPLLYQTIELHQKGSLSSNLLFSNIATFIFAGFETSATTLHSIISLLAMKPEYQERLFEEITNIFPNKEFNVAYEDLKNLVYMDQVINEAMRIASTIPSIGRYATKDIYLSDDLILPVGTNIFIDIFNLHTQEEIWGSNSKEFNPDNFLPENLNETHPYSFIPFVKGARNCIGWRYARIFLKISLAKIIRNFRFSTQFKFEDVRFLFSMAIRFKKIPKIKVYRR